MIDSRENVEFGRLRRYKKLAIFQSGEPSVRAVWQSCSGKKFRNQRVENVTANQILAITEPIPSPKLWQTSRDLVRKKRH